MAVCYRPPGVSTMCCWLTGLWEVWRVQRFEGTGSIEATVPPDDSQELPRTRFGEVRAGAHGPDKRTNPDVVRIG